MSVHLQRGVFQRFDPLVGTTPVVVDVSRSGREYPEEFRSPVSFTAIHDNVSMYVDQIWQATPELGGTLLYATFPNFWIDVNRHELDIDADLIEGTWPVPLQPTRSKTGLGLLKSKSRYGEAVHERKLSVAEVMERMDGYYHPYHAELKELLARRHAQFGTVYHLSCHCMSATGAPTHADAGKPRADFCLSNRNGETCSQELMEFVAGIITQAGFSCSLNDPYVGGEIVRRYGSPARGIESLQVEINKRQFMDVLTFKKTAGFHAIQATARAIVGALARRVPAQA
ncbi:MAG: N-formylglutamate amidohydrolase [Pseudomonadota bacterium]